MSSNFLPLVDTEQVKAAYESGAYDDVYELLAEPLHVELYKRQTFDFLDELSAGQQLFLAYDYLRTQVSQGGFIQFIENGYVGLLPSLIEQLNMVGANDMAQVLDDVLKVYVLNIDQLGKHTSVEEFVKLYEEFKEFEEIDARYNRLNLDTERKMLDYAIRNLNEFIQS